MASAASGPGPAWHAPAQELGDPVSTTSWAASWRRSGSAPRAAARRAAGRRRRRSGPVPDRAAAARRRGRSWRRPSRRRSGPGGRLVDAGPVEDHVVERGGAGHLPDGPDGHRRLAHVQQEAGAGPGAWGRRCPCGPAGGPVGVVGAGAPRLVAVDHPAAGVGRGHGRHGGEVGAGVRLAEQLAPNLAGGRGSAAGTAGAGPQCRGRGSPARPWPRRGGSPAAARRRRPAPGPRPPAAGGRSRPPCATGQPAGPAAGSQLALPRPPSIEVGAVAGAGEGQRRVGSASAR